MEILPKCIFDIIGGEKILFGIIRKGFFDRNREIKLVFTFDVVKELLRIDTQKEHHDIAREYYLEELKMANEHEYPNIYVEIIYHLMKMEEFEEASKLFISKTEFLKRAARGRVVEISEKLSENVSNTYERVFISRFFGNFLLVGKEFSKAKRPLIKALKIYRYLDEEDSDLCNSVLAKTLNDLGRLSQNVPQLSGTRLVKKA